MANQAYKFSDLKHGASAAVVNDIVAYLCSADINKAVQTFNPGPEVTLHDALAVDSLRKVAQSLDPSVSERDPCA